jgi:NADPH-dependent curcumin reductase CurA
LVFCDTGWTEYAAVPASTAVKLPKVDPLSHLVSVYGITAGFTAYIGMQRFGKPSRGETVVVSGAAGAVGLFAGQIAKIAGCTVIGIAGGENKCRYLLNEYAFDRAIDYKSKDVDEAFSAAITDGIDLYFDNVGGGRRSRVARRE